MVERLVPHLHSLLLVFCHIIGNKYLKSDTNDRRRSIEQRVSRYICAKLHYINRHKLLLTHAYMANLYI